MVRRGRRELMFKGEREDDEGREAGGRKSG